MHTEDRGYAVPVGAPDPAEWTPPDITPVRGYAIASTVLIAAVTAIAVWVMAESWSAYYQVEAVLAGDRVSRGEVFDAIDRIDRLALIYLITFIVTGVVFLAWQRRARENAASMCPARPGIGDRWAIAGWLVPVVNFVFPYIVISDIWKASRPGGRAVTDLSAQRPSRLVIGWWAVILIAALLNLTHRWLSSDEGATLESVHTLAVVDTVQCGFLALSAAGIISIIWRITSWQIATLPAPRKISGHWSERS